MRPDEEKVPVVLQLTPDQHRAFQQAVQKVRRVLGRKVSESEAYEYIVKDTWRRLNGPDRERYLEQVRQVHQEIKGAT